MDDRLPPDHQCIFPKSDARILWTLNEKFEIKEFKIYEICSSQRAESLFRNCQRVKTHIYSSGNCYSDWKEWTLEDVLLDVFKYIIADKDVLRMIFIQLGKIEEWSLRLSFFNGDYWGIQKKKASDG